ncbi:MAG: hypothetical protein ACRESZ_12445 [Methylococcales bacterium]
MLEDKDALNRTIGAQIGEKAGAYGLFISGIGIHDIICPGREWRGGNPENPAEAPLALTRQVIEFQAMSGTDFEHPVRTIM